MQSKHGIVIATIAIILFILPSPIVNAASSNSTNSSVYTELTAVWTEYGNISISPAAGSAFAILSMNANVNYSTARIYGRIKRDGVVIDSYNLTSSVYPNTVTFVSPYNETTGTHYYAFDAYSSAGKKGVIYNWTFGVVGTSTGGDVTSITGAPSGVLDCTGTTDVTCTVAQAGSGTSGYLSSANWVTFNGHTALITAIRNNETSYVTTSNTSYVKTDNSSYVKTDNTSYVKTDNSSYVKTDNTSYVKTSNTSYVLTNNASYVLTSNTSYPLLTNLTYPRTAISNTTPILYDSTTGIYSLLLPTCSASANKLNSTGSAFACEADANNIFSLSANGGEATTDTANLVDGTGITITKSGSDFTINNSIVNATVGMLIGDGTGVITTGIKGDQILDTNGTIIAARILANESGSLNVSFWKDTYDNFPPTSDDQIGYIFLSSGDKTQDTSLTNFTSTTITAGDVIRFNVISASTVERASVVLTIRRT